MTRDNIIRMAREAGFIQHNNPDLYDCMVASDVAIERFAALIAENERGNFCAFLRQMHDAYSLASSPAGLRARGER